LGLTGFALDDCGRLAPEADAVLVQALAAAREALHPQTRTRPAVAWSANVSAETPTFERRQADALALVAETALNHRLDPGAPRAPSGRRERRRHRSGRRRSVRAFGARSTACAFQPERRTVLACDASRGRDAP
jgi:hypothetical protein